MLSFRTFVLAAVLATGVAVAASAGDIIGTAADATGGVLPGAHVTLRNVATGVETFAQANAEGRFRFNGVPAGTYLVTVEANGFSRDARTVSVTENSGPVEVKFRLVPGPVSLGVNVTATRSERDAQVVPVRTDTIGRDALDARVPLSTGDALLQVPGVTAVGGGPTGVRPRLRGLDSTRLLVLVDGERLNNARTATDRSGTEVGLIDLATVEGIEVVGGSGSVLYGTDALAGTVNILTNRPRLTDRFRVRAAFDGYFSSNENGRRGTVTFGASDARFSVQVATSLENYDNYRAGRGATAEDTRPFFATGRLKQADTIDDNFGFRFHAFPDPFNSPYVRTTSRIPTSSTEGNNLNAAGLFAISGTQTLQVKYVRRRISDSGFPDFEAPMFFQRVSLPYNDLDRLSVGYEARSIAPWFTNLKISAYYQDQNRLLRNEFPVQFPVPSASFFPITVYRLNILSDTEQHVRTPGLDIQATFAPARGHVVTAGMMLYSDRSLDTRTSSTGTTSIGTVSLGAFGPQANVFAAPVVLGPPSTTHPVRVPEASFRNVGFFVQDEWDVARRVRLVAGMRLDQYRVATTPTAGYTVAALVSGAAPAIDPSGLPGVNGDTISRLAATGDLGAVIKVSDGLNVMARYGRSYRHPNLEEMLFAGPATVGTIVPNLRVRPETGDNVDVGVKLRKSRYEATLSYFNNRYHGFISTEIVANTPSGPLSQAINFSDVRIQGVESDVDAPIVLGPGVVTLFGNMAYTRGTVLAGANPLTGVSLAGTPQDNISPFKAVAGMRFSDARDRWWVEYGVRVQTKVNRVAPTMLDSPYLIAQDLLSLDGFAVHRLGWGVNLRPRGGRIGLVFAVENLTDRYYREQFQFAPARGRSFTFGLTVRGR